jgi:hypothetical protein
MRLIHTACLKELELRKRTIIAQPEDHTWPNDFVLELPFCRTCGGVFPPLNEIKPEQT